MFNANCNDEKLCGRLLNLLNNEIKFPIGVIVNGVDIGYNIVSNDLWLGISIIKNKKMYKLIDDYMSTVFGLRYTRVDTNAQKYCVDRILYSGLSRDKLMDIDVLCRMKGY